MTGAGRPEITGRMLRELRERAGLGLREVARTRRISDSHLSRVERGAREVTPSVIAAYATALGRPIDADLINELLSGSDDAQRRAFSVAVATIATGGLPGEHDHPLLVESSAFLSVPSRVGLADVTHVEHAAALVRALDLRYGGEQAGQMAYQLLRWAAGLRAAAMTDEMRRRLRVAVGALAAWAGWAAFDTGRDSAAGVLFTLALESAVRADEPDLRAHVLIDLAARDNHLGNPGDALRVVRLAAGDERVCPAVRCMLHGVRARAYAALGERNHCLREVELTEETATTVEPRAAPDWLGGWEPAHVRAVSGHAYSQLVETNRGGSTDLTEAQKRLEAAAGDLVAAGRRRAAALCLLRLARIHQRCGNPDEAASWADQSRQVAADSSSVRIRRALAAVNASFGSGAVAGRRFS